MKSSSETSLLKIELVILLLLIIPVYIASAAGGFNCSIMSSGSCGGGNTTVIYLQNDTGGYSNAHAQNVSVGTYDYVICCNSSSTLSYACNEGIFLRLKAAYNFDKCMNITISNAGYSTLTNFPAYINLTYDSEMLPDFRDIRFYDAPCNQGGNSLDYEIENYTTSDRAHVWVRIPSLPAAGKKISIHYKNNTAVSSGENPTGVWDSSYMAVWHMTEVNITDSTSNNNDGNESGGVTYTSSGIIDGADEFDGNDDVIDIDDSTSLSPTSELTVTAWFYPKNDNAAQYPVYKLSSYELSYDDSAYGSNEDFGGSVWNNTNDRIRTNNDSYPTDNWYHIVMTAKSNDEIKLYIDGELKDTTPFSGTIQDSGNKLTIGDYQGGGFAFNGTIDEVRISNTARSADWVNQTFQMVSNQGSFVSFGAKENGSGILKGSHVQRGDYSGPGIIYDVDVCLTADPGYLNCTYVDDSCPGNRECFASMASSNSSTNNNTDCHIGPCVDYKKKICCRVISDVTVTYENPTPGNNTRQTANSVTINVSVTTDSAVSADTCILEWKVGEGSPSNETMEMIGSGSSVTCNITKSTSDGTNYTFRVYANDTVGNLGSEGGRQFRENDEPDQVVLDSPADDSHITNRTPKFNWSVPSDADGDTLNYTINITCFPACSDDNRYVEDLSTNSYTPTQELQYFGDDNKYYNWSVRAGDGYEYGEWSDIWKLTIDTNVSIILLNDTVDFGPGRIPGYTDNSTDNDPYPFSLRNIGNCMIDVNLSSQDLLWDTASQPSDYFNYSVDWLTGEEGAFNWSGSQTSPANVPQVDQNVTFIDYMNYTSGNSSAEIDIYIEVPLGEPPGPKNSTIMFTGEYHV